MNPAIGEVTAANAYFMIFKEVEKAFLKVRVSFFGTARFKRGNMLAANRVQSFTAFTVVTPALMRSTSHVWRT